jgi:hypothetical protein
MFQSGWRRVADDVRDFSSETQKAVLYYWRDNGTVQVLTLHRGSWTARYWWKSIKLDSPSVREFTGPNLEGEEQNRFKICNPNSAGNFAKEWVTLESKHVALVLIPDK